MYLEHASYQGKCLGTSRFSTLVCLFWLRRRFGSLVVFGSKMKLFLISVFPSPLRPVGKALVTWDMTKSLSDISRVPFIFYLKLALFLDSEGPRQWAQWKSIQAAASQRNTILACVYPSRAVIVGKCLCTDELREETDVNWCAWQLPVYSCMKGMLDTASSPVVPANNAIIQAWPYLGRAQCYVNKAFCWGEGSVLHSCPCPSTVLAESSAQKR